MPLVVERELQKEEVERGREPFVYFCPQCFWIWGIHCDFGSFLEQGEGEGEPFVSVVYGISIVNDFVILDE